MLLFDERQRLAAATASLWRSIRPTLVGEGLRDRRMDNPTKDPSRQHPYVRAWTGSHRLAAARAVGLEAVPVVVMSSADIATAHEKSCANAGPVL